MKEAFIKNLFIFAFLVYVVFPLKLCSQWQTFYPPVNYFYWEISVVNSNVTFACGDHGNVIRTTNSGLSWQVISSGFPDSLQFYNISATDENNVTVVGGSNNVRIFRTTNGGAVWTEQFYAHPNPITKIKFFNSNTGVFLAQHNNPTALDSAGFYITRNGGVNWNHAPNSPMMRIPDYMNALDSNFIWFIASHKLYTLNNGLNNFFQEYDVPSGSYCGSFKDINYGYFGGLTNNDSVYFTSNGGSNWASINYVQGVNSTSSILVIPGTNWVLINGFNNILLSYNNCSSFLSSVTINTGLGNPDAKDSSSIWIPGNGRLYKYNINFIGIQQISSEVPKNFILHQNYPNPFNPNTKIEFELPKTSDITFIVYDLLGKEVYKVNEQSKQAGKYAIDFNAVNLASGIYYYQIDAGYFTQTKKMILLK